MVVVLFPFSDLKGGKHRPALVVAEAEFDNLILCQITSKSYTSTTAVRLTAKDFANGGLPIVSYVRPDKLFTADPTIVTRSVGTVTATKQRQILNQIRALFHDRQSIRKAPHTAGQSSDYTPGV